MDRHTLYEHCVQSPGDLVRVLRAVHGSTPRVLGEDFCGTAAVSRAWVEQVESGRAIAVDHDADVLGRAPRDERIRLVHADAANFAADDAHRVDVLWVGNFSIGEWHERERLVGYLDRARRRLAPGGIFVCDLYGGESAFLEGTVEREHPLEEGALVRYTWEQRQADPLTGRVVNAMHFVVEREGEVSERFQDAFVYDWRLWGVPELRDAMRDAEFVSTNVFARTPDALDDEGRAYARPLDATDLGDSFDVLVAARA